MINIEAVCEEGVWYVQAIYMESGAVAKYACPNKASALLKVIKWSYK